MKTIKLNLVTEDDGIHCHESCDGYDTYETITLCTLFPNAWATKEEIETQTMLRNPTCLKLSET